MPPLLLASFSLYYLLTTLPYFDTRGYLPPPFAAIYASHFAPAAYAMPLAILPPKAFAHARLSLFYFLFHTYHGTPDARYVFHRLPLTVRASQSHFCIFRASFGSALRPFHRLSFIATIRFSPDVTAFQFAAHRFMLL